MAALLVPPEAVPIEIGDFDAATPNPMVGLGRLELPTSRLSGVRSNHLSYRPKDARGQMSRPHARSTSALCHPKSPRKRGEGGGAIEMPIDAIASEPATMSSTCCPSISSRVPRRRSAVRRELENP